MRFLSWFEDFTLWAIGTFLIGAFPMLYPWLNASMTIHHYNLVNLFGSAEGFSVCVAICAGIFLDEAPAMRRRYYAPVFAALSVIGAGIAAYMYGQMLATQLAKPSNEKWWTSVEVAMIGAAAAFAVFIKITQRLRYALQAKHKRAS